MKKALFIAANLLGSYGLYGAVNYSHKPESFAEQKQIKVVNENLETVRLGFDFALRFQSLKHENDGTKTVDDVELSTLKAGFTNATGNANLSLSLSPGVYSYVETYLSSEHHLEMWMREGYLFIDHLEGTSFSALNDMMEYLSFKVGQMEINYGDAHFRRTDNGEALRNPFVGNYVIDPNTTEIGMEVLVNAGQVEFLLGATGGTTKGDNKDDHGFATYTKLAYDTSWDDTSKFRISGSYYIVDHSDNGPSSYPAFDGTKSYLYAGNRSGSPYAFIFDTETDAGQINPRASQDLSAYMVNILLQVGNTELFLNYDEVRDADIDGADSDATLEEAWSQYAVDIKQNFGRNNYIAVRHNQAKHLKAAGADSDEAVVRNQLALGHFLTPNALLKLEYVQQEYKDFNTTGDLRNGGKFSGFLMEGSVHF